MELFIEFLRFGQTAKLSAKNLKEGIIIFYPYISCCIIGGYLLSYIIFSQMHKAKNPEIKEILCDFGKFGLGMVITGHIAFLVIYKYSMVLFNNIQPVDHYIHLFFIGLMVFYVYYCNKQLSKMKITKNHYR